MKNFIFRFVFVFFFFFSAVASADSCWMGKFSEKQIRDINWYISEADLIFSGEVELVVKEIIHRKGSEEYISEIIADFSDLEVFKGEKASSISIIGDEICGCGCKYEFYPGVRYFVMAKIKKGRYITYFCEHIKPVELSLEDDFRSVLKPR